MVKIVANNCDKSGSMTQDLRKIMKDSLNEQLIVERQREVCAANFIIYGIKETGASEESLKENDGIILSLFLEKVNP